MKEIAVISAGNPHPYQFCYVPRACFVAKQCKGRINRLTISTGQAFGFVAVVCDTGISITSRLIL